MYICSTVAAADLSPASVNGPDVFLSISRKCYLSVSGVQMLHRCLLRRKLLHVCLSHTTHTHHTQAGAQVTQTEFNKNPQQQLSAGQKLFQSNYVNTHTRHTDNKVFSRLNFRMKYWSISMEAIMSSQFNYIKLHTQTCKRVK